MSSCMTSSSGRQSASSVAIVVEISCNISCSAFRRGPRCFAWETQTASHPATSSSYTSMMTRKTYHPSQRKMKPNSRHLWRQKMNASDKKSKAARNNPHCFFNLPPTRSNSPCTSFAKTLAYRIVCLIFVCPSIRMTFCTLASFDSIHVANE